MHELACPSCSTPSQYDLTDYILMCTYCSTSFHMNVETGVKELCGDHYIVPGAADAATVKESTTEWLRRMHHNQKSVETDYLVTNVAGSSVPYWVISLEAHTVWKGLIRKQHRPHSISRAAGHEYLMEKGQFRRDYRWAVSARSNICETWGLARLHEPKEPVAVEWDGFPLDSTWSRGHMSREPEKTLYESREFFDFKYANGLPILGVQVSEEEAMQRAQAHVRLFHYKLAMLNAEYILDNRTELEIAGIQLIHIPLWQVQYVYRPKSTLKYLFPITEKHLVVDGFAKAILNSELAVVKQDKLRVNAIICAAASLVFFFAGLMWSNLFILVALFSTIVSAVSFYMSVARQEEDRLAKMAAAAEKTPQQQARPKAVPERSRRTV